MHRASRIAGAAHGGEIVVSEATAETLTATDGMLVDLGEHRLEDLSAPIRLFQLGDGEFPLLRTLRRTNLPIPAVAEVLDGLAIVRSLGGEDEHAGRPWGAAQVLKESAGATPEPLLDALRGVRERVGRRGEEAYERALAAGAAMELEEVLAELV